MKKLIIFIIFLCVIAVWTTKRFHKDDMNPLILNNVEAIASDERPNIGRCYGQGSIDCPAGNRKVEYVGIGYSLEIQ